MDGEGYQPLFLSGILVNKANTEVGEYLDTELGGNVQQALNDEGTDTV